MKKRKSETAEPLKPVFAEWPQDVAGASTVEKLLAAYHRGGLHPVILFDGSRTAGASQTALKFVGGLLCEQGRACGLCDSCKRLQYGIHEDFLYMDGRNETLKLEHATQIQEHLSVCASSSFSEGRKAVRAIWIDGAENLHWTAANRLLKIFEEPPGEAFIIMTTYGLDRVLQTVRSRAMTIKVKPTKGDEVPAIPENTAEMYRRLLSATSLAEALGLASGAKGASLEAGWIEAFELSLNKYYRELLGKPLTYAFFTKMMHRREVLQELHMVSRRQRINVNQQMALEQFAGC